MKAASDKKEIIVLAFGTFDLLHLGHLSYLKQAKGLGDKLYVIVARDSNVKSFKGFFPAQKENGRLGIIQNLRLVDYATLGDKTNFFSKIKKINPDVIALGYDQWPGKPKLQKMLDEHKISGRIVRLKPYKKNHHKTTLIKKRIKSAA